MRNDQIEEVEEKEVEVSIEKKTKATKKPKGRVGRPRAAVPKDKRVMSHFTEKEKLELTELAEKRGQSLSNFVRLAALRELAEENV